MLSIVTGRALGFETHQNNQYALYYQYHIYKDFTEMKINDVGFLFDDTTERQERQNDSALFKTLWKIANWLKILGYIPIIGSIVGLYRYSEAIKAQNLPSKNVRVYYAYQGQAQLHKFRAIIEISCLGLLLFIPDLILLRSKISLFN